jgi:lipoprotein NlpI
MLGENAGAGKDFAQVISLAPGGAPYAVLWLTLATRRSHQAAGGALAAGTSALDPNQWPAPILRFLLGQISGDVLAKAAVDPDAGVTASRQCEVAFYGGEAALIAGHKDEASADLTRARTLCNERTLEAAAATLALDGK